MAFATDSRETFFFFFFLLPAIDSENLQFYSVRFLSLGVILVVFLIWSLLTLPKWWSSANCMYPRQELLPTVTDKKSPIRQAPWPRFQLPSSLTLPLFSLPTGYRVLYLYATRLFFFIVAISMNDLEVDRLPSLIVAARQHGKRWSERRERGGGAIYLERHLETRRCHCEKVCFPGVDWIGLLLFSRGPTTTTTS